MCFCIILKLSSKFITLFIVATEMTVRANPFVEISCPVLFVRHFISRANDVTSLERLGVACLNKATDNN